MSGADVTAKHEGRSTIGPALKDVGTTCFLTDRVQIKAFNQFEDMVLIDGITQPNLEPFGFRRARFGVVDYCKFARQAVLLDCLTILTLRQTFGTKGGLNQRNLRAYAESVG